MKKSPFKLPAAPLSLTRSVALALGAASSSANAHDRVSTNPANPHHKSTKAKAVPAHYLKGTARTSKTGMGVQLDYAFTSAGLVRSGLLRLTIARRGGATKRPSLFSQMQTCWSPRACRHRLLRSTRAPATPSLLSPPPTACSTSTYF